MRHFELGLVEQLLRLCRRHLVTMGGKLLKDSKQVVLRHRQRHNLRKLEVVINLALGQTPIASRMAS